MSLLKTGISTKLSGKKRIDRRRNVMESNFSHFKIEGVSKKKQNLSLFLLCRSSFRLVPSFLNIRKKKPFILVGQNFVKNFSPFFFLFCF